MAPRKTTRKPAKPVKARLDADLQKKAPTKLENLENLPKTDVYFPNQQLLSGQVPVQLPPFFYGGWSAPQVQEALDQLQLGQFQRASALGDAIISDPRIFGMLQTRTQALTSIPLKFLPANDTPEALTIAEEVDREWRSWVSETEAEKFHRNILMYGIGLGQLIWTPVPSEDHPDIPDRLIPEFSTWSNAYMWWTWDNERNYGRWWVTVKQGTLEPIDGDGKIVFAKKSEFEPWNEGLIRGLSKRWLARAQNWSFWSRFNDRMGTPILKILQAMEDNQQDIEPVKNYLQSAIQGGSPLLFLPQGKDGNSWDAVWESVKDATGWSSFDTQTKIAADDAAILILGQTLTSDTGSDKGGGSYALGKVHGKVAERLLNADAKMMPSFWREQVLKPYCYLNYGDADLAPIPTYNTDPPEDLAAKATALTGLASFLSTAPNPDLIDIPALYRQYKVPLKADEGKQVN